MDLIGLFVSSNCRFAFCIFSSRIQSNRLEPKSCLNPVFNLYSFKATDFESALMVGGLDETCDSRIFLAS